MNAYSDIADLPNHVIPPQERRTRATTAADVGILVAVLLFALAVAAAVWTFGLVALGLTAVAAVPVVMLIIVMITLG